MNYVLWVIFGAVIILQENIRDKLRAIPIDVSVAIEETKRKLRQTPAPQLPPVLDADDQMPTRKEVCVHHTKCIDELIKGQMLL